MLCEILVTFLLYPSLTNNKPLTHSIFQLPACRNNYIGPLSVVSLNTPPHSLDTLIDVLGLEEGANRHSIVLAVADLFRFVVERVKLALFECHSNLLEKQANGFAVSQLLEIVLADADFSRCRRVHKVDSFRLITVVLVLSD